MKSDTPHRVRWRLFAVILLVIVGAVGWVWFVRDADSRQDRVLATEGILSGGGVALLIWLAVLSRLRGRTRVLAGAAVALVAGVFFSAFRYAGVDGDLIPVFVPRWRTVELIVTGAPLTGVAMDFPQFGGPGRDGVVTGVALLRDWEGTPPSLVWRRPVGGGWSGFAVVGERAVTHEQHGEEERVVCYELGTGEVVWSRGNVAGYTSKLAGEGPRATPTIEGGSVFTLGATGVLSAFDLESGRRSWAIDVIADVAGKIPAWGLSGSPLVHGGNVLVGTGAAQGPSLAAYDAATGARVWAAGEGSAGYASPRLVTLAGVTQVVVFNNNSVAGHDPSDGRVLWSHPWSARQPNVAQPLPVGPRRLLVSSGYGIGSELIELTPRVGGGFEVATIWASRRLKSKFASMILHDAHVFGLDDGILTCVALATGQRRWKGGRYGHGQLLRVGSDLLVMAESGDVVLVALDGDEHREVTRFQAIDGKVWNPPALAGSRLLVRNDQEAALFLLPVK